MRLTASQALPQLPVTKEQLEGEYNKGTKPLLEQLRTAANAVGRERATGTSDGAGTWLVLWTSDTLPQDCIWDVEARVAGVATASSKRATYRLIQSVISVAGTIAAFGATTVIHTNENAAACDARITVDVANRVVTVDARDDAVTAMYWTTVVETTEGLPAP